MIDFDEIDDWFPKLTENLKKNVPESVLTELSRSEPEYVEDALSFIFEKTDKNIIVNKALDWIHNEEIIGYHGSRLTEDDIRSIKSKGLLPLDTKTRRIRLVRALSPHPNWEEAFERLDDELIRFSQDNYAGERKNQVHLTISRAGLVQGFNHYITHGSEFDQHVAHALLGKDSQNLLEADGKPYLLKVLVDGKTAISNSHTVFSPQDLLERGETPNIVREFLQAWAYHIAYPDFQCSELEIDCGIIFKEAISADSIIDITEIQV